MQLFSFISSLGRVLFALGLLCSFACLIAAQHVVQPGAPGQPTKVLPSDTRAKLPPTSAKDVEFMQGMIHHHAQAVEMTAMIEERTQNKSLRLIGERISRSQQDEINFMRRWLEMRGQPLTMEMANKAQHATPNASHSHGPPKGGTPTEDEHLMPGMLTKAQMDALRNSKGAEFDRLFLAGMIQHHNGALVMVKDLFDTAGSGQDAELFTFATDVDSGQRAEIKSLKTLLDKNP